MTIARGCGSRIQGAVYAEVGFGEWGHPIQEFYSDPPVPVDPDHMQLSHIGVTVIQGGPSNTVSSTIVDWVGMTDYPYPADVLAEALFVDPDTGKRAGLSRRLPRTLDWAQLGPTPVLALVHTRAIPPVDWQMALLETLNGHHDYIADRRSPVMPQFDNLVCPRQIRAEHCREDLKSEPHPAGLCPALWWCDVPRQNTPGPMEPPFEQRFMPGGKYPILLRPDGEPGFSEYGVGILATLPVSRIAVVRDSAGGAHELALQKLAKLDSAVHVEVVDD